jgi:hypothetical protein
MKMNQFRYFILSACITFGFFYCSSSQSGHAQSQKIILIRHGEKPDQGDNLSCQGLNRALQLPAVLQQKFGIPNHIFVPAINEGKATKVARMYQTIVPFAVKYNIDVNTKYDVDDIDGITGAIKKQQGEVLLVWEHKKIIKIIKALGINTEDKWDDNDFDSIWIISFNNGVPILTKDKENIHPAATCP